MISSSLNALLSSPWLVAVVGLFATLALIAIHRLRTQPIRKRVVTTLFWSAVPQHQKQNVLWGRFSRRGTFALLMVLLMLLVVGMTGVGWERIRGETYVVVVMDSGYSMSAVNTAEYPTRLDEAVAMAHRDLGELAPSHLAVVEAGGEPRLLAPFSVPSKLALRQLATIKPTTQPSSSSRALELAETLIPPSAQAKILYYSDHTPTLTTKSERIQVCLVDVPVRNSAIVGVMLEDTTVFVQTATTGPSKVQPPSSLRLRLSRTVAGSADIEAPVDIATGVAAFPNVISDGSTLIFTLLGDDAGVSADNTATITLPRSQSLRFSISGEVPPALVAAISALSPFDAAGGPDKAIPLCNVVGPSVGLAIGLNPSIRVVKGSGPHIPDGAEVMSVPGAAWVQGLQLRGATVAGGPSLGELPSAAVPLLTAGDQTIAAYIPAISGQGPELRLAQVLFDQSSTLTARPAFFVLFKRAAFAMAGIPSVPISLPLKRVIDDPTFASGVATNMIPGDRLSSDLSIANSATDLKVAAGLNTSGISIQPWQLVLLVSLIVLGAEAFLYTYRRIP